MGDMCEELDLKTDRLILTKIQYSHVDDLFEVYSNPEAAIYVPREVHKMKEETHSLIENMLATIREGKALIWSIMLKDTQKVIGTCRIWLMPHNSASIGAVISPAYWGKGLIVEALEELIEIGFQELNINRMEGRCDAENIASERVMQKLKMVYEGILRQSVKMDNTYRDAKVYSLLKEEYNGLKNRA
ncbi:MULTISPECIES: GNAT family protein [Bacillus]|uniref:GNAT family N-acetyltransferase n=1 Tax=Bacillus anthracis TaxID=1392 RepID=A0A2B0Y8V1_BACAN|nr:MULTISPECIES: GNAT family protein [Bacillus]MCU0095018.1 GNAT family N-acetyltransferase [Bacillus sp. OR9]MBJ8061390.1 GNAT family N-acetyltransferase [Bacillus cereus]MCU4758869.1 GNAT family N-acetyltransferase [Bacillus cereus]MCU5109074.1 GNAT family N-acetyltransferase [Bacillus cereus]MCU5341763.1 GNAT family N-acetyltransferase [Bacillus cereus]